MIFGIGTDIIEIDRIKNSVEKYGERFLNKIYTENELEYCLSKKNKYQHLAARFAAKEAIAKALTTGWNSEFKWTDINISNEPSGLPIVELKGNLENFLGEDKALKITMSHSNNYATCFAILFAK